MKNISEIILWHTEKYPEMEISDLYKLLFQSAMGPGHAVTNRFSAIQWMDDEIKNLKDYDDKSMIEELPDTNGLIRVNLRPYFKQGGSREKLLEAFISTANTFQGNAGNLKEHLALAVTLCGKDLIKFKPEVLEEFFIDMESRGFPAIHHSETYRQKYKPAYRVVLREFFD